MFDFEILTFREGFKRFEEHLHEAFIASESWLILFIAEPFVEVFFNQFLRIIRSVVELAFHKVELFG
jgi:hypothetical protein